MAVQQAPIGRRRAPTAPTAAATPAKDGDPAGDSITAQTSDSALAISSPSDLPAATTADDLTTPTSSSTAPGAVAAMPARSIPLASSDAPSTGVDPDDLQGHADMTPTTTTSPESPTSVNATVTGTSASIPGTVAETELTRSATEASSTTPGATAGGFVDTEGDPSRQAEASGYEADYDGSFTGVEEASSTGPSASSTSPGSTSSEPTLLTPTAGSTRPVEPTTRDTPAPGGEATTSTSSGHPAPSAASPTHASAPSDSTVTGAVTDTTPSDGHGDGSAVAGGRTPQTTTSATAAPTSSTSSQSIVPSLTGQAPTATSANVAQAPVPRDGVDLAQAIETLHGTIELAARQGISQARITLYPENLGDIRIHLSQTGEGLVARVMAQTQAATQALAEGHAELRQSLSSLGVSLLRLDIGSFNQPGAHGNEGRAAEGSGTPSGSARSSDATDNEDPQTSPEVGSTQHALESTAGMLVDVLA